MPEVRISIGDREFDVACQEGEEHFLTSAAAVLNEEASVLVAQIGRLPEARMLLMSGLMLADKTAGLSDKLKVAEAQLGEQQARIEELEMRDPATAAPIAAVPENLTPVLEAAAEKAEAIAEALELKAAG